MTSKDRMKLVYVLEKTFPLSTAEEIIRRFYLALEARAHELDEDGYDLYAKAMMEAGYVMRANWRDCEDEEKKG